MSDPRDDFGCFAGSEHMFFGIREPFGLIREQVENMFRSQVASSRIHSIRAEGEPKFLTIGRRSEPDDGMVVVSHFAMCFRCSVDVESDEHREPALRCTMMMAFGDVDKRGEARMRAWMDLHADADAAFDDEVFRQRFLEFRYALDA